MYEPGFDAEEKLRAVAVQPAPTGDTTARHLVESYTAEIEARRGQLLDDLVIYQGKVRDLEQLDPLDFTGLGRLYRTHVNQIEELLHQFNDID